MRRWIIRGIIKILGFGAERRTLCLDFGSGDATCDTKGFQMELDEVQSFAFIRFHWRTFFLSKSIHLRVHFIEERDMFGATNSRGDYPADAYIDQKEIGKLYDTKASIYDAWAYLTETEARERSLELAGISDGQSILEVAVGTGLAFYEIVKKNPGGVNIGIDLSDGMLEKAKKRLSKLRLGNYSLSVMSAYDLKVENETIDTLFNNYMFDLIPFDDFKLVLDEFYRVLKPNGKLILVNMTRPEKSFSGIYEQIYKLSPRTMGGCRGVQMSGVLSENGFKVETREYHQQFLFPSEVIVANKL